jgi:transformer-2 protein
MKARDSCNGMRLDGRNIRIDFSLTKCPHSPTPGRYMGRINRNRRSDSRYDRYSPRRRSPHRDRYDPYDDRYYGRSSRYDDRYGSSYGYGSDRRSDRDYY